MRAFALFGAALIACGSARLKHAEAPGEAGAPAPVLRSRVPEPGPPAALRLPTQHHFELANGLRVRLVEEHKLPIVSLHLVVNAGTVTEPPGKPGVASFTAAMLTEGTRRRSATRISDDLGFIGAGLTAGSSSDFAWVSGSVLSAHLAELLDIFADVVANPAFPRADFRRVQDQRLVSLIQERDRPGATVAKAFQALYWGDHPYGHWPLGTEKSVRATRREDLMRHHASRYRPNASELVVVGDVEESNLKALLEKALRQWRGTAPTPPRPARPRPPALQTLLIGKRGPASQSYVMMGMPGLERSSPDYVAGEVAFQVLGGGTASRLFRDLREKEGYTYGIYARPDARKLGGTSLIVGSVKADVTGAAMRALLKEVADLRERPVMPEELAVARNALLFSLPADFATAAGTADKLGEEVVFGLPDDYWEQFAGQVAQVSTADVQRMAQKYLDAAKLTTVMLCNPTQVRPQLDALPLGTIEVRDAPATKASARR